MKALLIVDIQKGLTNRKLYNHQIFINTVVHSINKYRESGNLIVFLQHNNKQLIQDDSDWEIDTQLPIHKNDIIIQKEHGNAFENTTLKSILDDNNISDILICGLVSHGCIKLTCIGGIELGYRTGLLKNGHTNWNKDADKKISDTELELMQLGVSIVDIQSL